MEKEYLTPNKRNVLKALKGKCLYRDEIKIEGMTQEEISSELNQLINTGYIHQHEDMQEHDWDYSLTKKGNEAVN